MNPFPGGSKTYPVPYPQHPPGENMVSFLKRWVNITHHNILIRSCWAMRIRWPIMTKKLHLSAGFCRTHGQGKSEIQCEKNSKERNLEFRRIGTYYPGGLNSIYGIFL
jgi:hypothetical protein